MRISKTRLMAFMLGCLLLGNTAAADRREPCEWLRRATEEVGAEYVGGTIWFFSDVTEDEIQKAYYCGGGCKLPGVNGANPRFGYCAPGSIFFETADILSQDCYCQSVRN